MKSIIFFNILQCSCSNNQPNYISKNKIFQYIFLLKITSKKKFKYFFCYLLFLHNFFSSIKFLTKIINHFSQFFNYFEIFFNNF